ncbi:ATP-binding cassette domain-containing protein [Nesterenkonia xinjiangensis]|uniref:Iron complex transport system ATP-binding protein n=1 Tax=Nesterenkonia xinjiangensis TaxID=225327 RepID=A0A7Z0GK43_9MICC|nr:iron complex transport system ATP-binding protein [Nesterenkonia xinjiangensis]
MRDHTSRAAGLRARGVTVGYGAEPVLDRLDFTVPLQRFTAIIGPNGCGKSTLLKALARTLRPQRGTVELDDVPLTQWRSRQLARRIGLLPQSPVVPDGITMRSLVARGRHPYHSPLRQWLPGDDEAIELAMEATGITDLGGARAEDLSGGQRQRAWIAMVLAQDTDLVLLDEPTSALDIAHQVEVLHLCQDIRDQGRSVVAVLHDLNQAARYADHLVVMRRGEIFAAGDPQEVLTPSTVSEVFSLDSELVPDPQAGSPMVVPCARRASPERMC